MSICDTNLCISTTIGWVAVKFSTDIYGALRIKVINFDDPLTFNLVPLSGEILNLSGTLVYGKIHVKLTTLPSASAVLVLTANNQVL